MVSMPPNFRWIFALFCGSNIVVPRGGKYGFDTDIVPMTGI